MYSSAIMHSSSPLPPASRRSAARLSFAPMRLLLLGLLLFVLTAPLCAAGNTYYVSPSGNDNNAGTQVAPFKTIHQAFNNASTGDTVTLAAGTYTGPGNVDLDMMGKSLTVNSVSGAAMTIIDCGGTSTANHRAFYFHTSEANAVISGLTIQHCYESTNYSDGAVSIASGVTVTLLSCIFSGNTIANYGDAGGGVSNSGTVTLTNCTFSGNTAFNGGGVSSGGIATLTNCTFSGNTSTNGNGGGVSCSGTATLTNCTFSNNTTPNNGGGVAGGGTVTLANCTFNGNTAFGGGGFSTNGNYGMATLTNCTIGSNAATKNTASNSGGGVCNTSYGGTVIMSGCTVSSNTAPAGGGVYSANISTTRLMGCNVSGNSATSGNGGGVYSGGAATLTNCLVAGNTAINGNGGGIYNSGSGGSGSNIILASLQFCTLVGNSTSGSSTQGGGLENDGTSTLTDDILWSNTAPNGAEIGTATTGNPVTTVTYSDIQGGLSGTGNIHADPLFVNAASDFHVSTGSPCLLAGTPIAGVTTDLDGKARGSIPTIGAYEIAAVAATNGTTSLTSSLNPSGVGQSVTFTATVKVNSGSPALAGTVQFASDGLNLGGPVPLNGSSTATASTSTSSLTLGTHQITATFTSTNAFSGNPSASLSQTVAGHTHLLWNNTDGRVMLWSIAPDGTFTLNGFGPYTDNGPSNVWHATALATGADGKSHIVWNNTDGRVMLWTVDDAGNFSLAGYGPYTDNAPQNIWHAVAVSVGPDNTVHLLWSNTDHRAMLWSVDSAFNFSLAGYGPYTDNAPNNLWTATALATGPDNLTRILWGNTDHRAMLWNVDSAFNFTLAGYGPYTDNAPQNLWDAVGVSVGTDSLPHLLWGNTDRRAMFWDLDGSFNLTALWGYGPYTDNAPGNLWSVTGLATGPDGMSHLLWNNTDNRVMLWGVDSAGNFTVAGYGPYTDNAPGNLWSVTAVSAGP